MQINTDFYSAVQEDVPNQYGVKRFTKTYKQLLNDGDLPFNEEWDKTLSPWGIGISGGNYQNDLINKCWTFPDIDRIRFNPSAPDPNLIMRVPLYAESDSAYPFWIQWQDGGQGTGYGYANWNERNAYDITELPDTYSVKTNNYIATAFNYKRFVFLIEVYIYTYGEDNPSLTASNYYYGSWYRMSDISDSVYTEILSRQKAIGAVRFIPYYATNENNESSRALINSSQFKPLCGFQPLDFFFGDEPYTTDYIDYTINSYAGVGSYSGNAGITTAALGMQNNSGFSYLCKYRQEWDWIFYANITAWGTDWFQKSQTFQNFGTDSDYWYNNVLNGNDWQYIYFRQILSVDLLDSKDKIIDYIYTQAAYLGTFFTPNYTTATSGKTDGTDSEMYIGIIGSNGITTGTYKHGSELPSVPQTGWINPWEESEYDPYSGVDPTDWDENQTSVLQTTTGDPAYGTNEFLMTETALQQLLKVMEEFKVAEAEGEIVSGFCEKAFGYTDPIKSIVSVIKYPFDMVNDWNGSGRVVSGSDVGSLLSIANAQIPVSIGSGGSAPPFTILIPSAHDIFEINWGSSVWKYGRAYIPYFQKFENFLAYEPFCTASLYVPFCGSVRLDPEVYVSHNVGVEYYVSPLDGTCKAYILRDNLVIDTLTGNIGTSIEINSSDDLAKANNINLLNSNIQAQKMNLLKQAASFSVGSAVNAGLNSITGATSMVRSAVDLTFSALQTQNTIDRLEYQIETTQTPFKQLQPGGGYLSSCDEWSVRLVAYRPEPLIGYSFDNWKEFPTLCGFACLLNDTLDNFTGFTKCATVKLDGIAATAQEKQQIRKLLQSGVYL